MKLESKRLYMYPLNDAEMKSLVEKEENPVMKQAYSEMLGGCLADPANRVWYAMWYMELKEFPGSIAGEFCFKGIGSRGAVEIGYGLRDGYCGKGYMTEAVKAVSGWALTQKDVTRIKSETDPDNLASQRVLFNAGFISTGEYGEEGPIFEYK